MVSERRHRVAFTTKAGSLRCSLLGVRGRLIGAVLISTSVLAAMSGCAVVPGSAEAPITVASSPLSGGPPVPSDGVIAALIGGALGPEGGYLIGVQSDRLNPKFRDQAVLAARNAEVHPAESSDVKDSDTADLNHNGYVTMDELIAMRDAGVNDDELIRRLRTTNQVFELTAHQRNYLRDDAINERVIDAMLAMSRDVARTANVDPDRIIPANDRNTSER
jgi:hypothetical protein